MVLGRKYKYLDVAAGVEPAVAVSLKSPSSERRPPSPLPKGEGTDRGDWESYADAKYRVEHKF